MRQISQYDGALGELDNKACTVEPLKLGCTGGISEGFPDALTSHCRAFQIVPGPNLSSYSHTLTARE